MSAASDDVAARFRCNGTRAGDGCAMVGSAWSPSHALLSTFSSESLSTFSSESSSTRRLCRTGLCSLFICWRSAKPLAHCEPHSPHSTVRSLSRRSVDGRLCRCDASAGLALAPSPKPFGRASGMIGTLRPGFFPKPPPVAQHEHPKAREARAHWSTTHTIPAHLSKQLHAVTKTFCRVFQRRLRRALLGTRSSSALHRLLLRRNPYHRPSGDAQCAHTNKTVASLSPASMLTMKAHSGLTEQPTPQVGCVCSATCCFSFAKHLCGVSGPRASYPCDIPR